MKNYRKLTTPPKIIVGALIVLVSVGAVSHRDYRPCPENTNSCEEIDPLAGDPASRWSVYGALSSSEVSLSRSGPDTVAVRVHPNDPAELNSDSGINYTTGLSKSGWYEFTAELESTADQGSAVQGAVEPGPIEQAPHDQDAPGQDEPDRGAADGGQPDQGAPEAGAADQNAGDQAAPDQGGPDQGAPDQGAADPGCRRARQG
jgi:hypothetical protein